MHTVSQSHDEDLYKGKVGFIVSQQARTKEQRAQICLLLINWVWDILRKVLGNWSMDLLEAAREIFQEVLLVCMWVALCDF